jgi:4-amino-4-deoxy-L-arabinose transferase-like glycosyltransferase
VTSFSSGQSRRCAPWVVGVVAAVIFYAAGVPGNRLTFQVDESSIAYNAYLIARTGADEFGIPWPTYFLAFGEYKNPTYIYLLAALFALAGPSILLARLFSAALGCAAALLLGLLAERTAGRRAGAFVALTALLTPWLFETSRLVFEVALYPLAMVLFLLALHRASTRWSWVDSACLALALGLVTYAYSVGRLLGPLLALGLVLFAPRRGWAPIAGTWLAYAVTLLPLLAFGWLNPGALTARFNRVTYITENSPPGQIVATLLGHYVGNLSLRRLLVTGDPGIEVHVPGMGSLLAATAVLAVGGLALVLRSHWRDPWWRFVLYALGASLVPASLTACEFCTLRLIAFPILLLVLVGPAWEWLLGDGRWRTVRRGAAGVILGATLVQGALFQWQFYRDGPRRPSDLAYLTVFDAAVAAPQRPIHLLVGPGRLGYIHAHWYGTLRGLDGTQFVRLPGGERPPVGGLVLGEADARGCGPCQIVRREGPYVAYRAP